MIDCSVYMTVSQSKSEQHVTVGCKPAFDLGNKDAEENQSDFYKHLFATAMCHLLTIINGSL